jgi:uncharacterized protein
MLKRNALACAVTGALLQVRPPNPAVIRVLLDAGAPITPHVMVEAGKTADPGIVQLLLDAGGDVNASTKGSWTALSSAIYLRHAEVVRVLLDAGASPDCMVYQQTAPAAAQESGNTDIVKLLQAAGAK